MAKTLVTGGSGFLGSHVVRALAKRGDELRLLVREGTDTGHLDGVDFEPIRGDVVDPGAVRRAVEGASRVFHLAGTTSMRRGSRERVFEVNVAGTRNVMRACLRAGVERVVHTSTVAAIGVARPGETIDEDQMFTAGGLGIAYVNSKHEGEAEALRAAARGLPVVVVNPSFVLGPDDPKGTSNALIRRFLLRQIPFYVDGGLNVVDVRDVAAGHLLADEDGHEGERYILSGRNFSLQRLFADLARISGVPPPPLKVPAAPVIAWIRMLESLGIPAPSSADEVRSGSQWFTCRNDKAKRALGFRPRPHEETLEDTVRWQLDVLGRRADRRRLVDPVMRAVGSVAGLADQLPWRRSQ